jgi:hypothetical protein
VAAGLLAAGGAAAQSEPTPNRITVDFSWADPHMIFLGYEIVQGSVPFGGPGEWDGHGCAWLPEEYADGTPNTLEIDSREHPAGAYHVAAWFVNRCLDFTAVGEEDPDPLDTYEAYPDGAPIEVTATIRFWEGDRLVRTETASGFTSAADGPVTEYWAVLTTVVLTDPAAGTGDGEDELEAGEPAAIPEVPEGGQVVAPGQEADAGEAAGTGLPPWMDPSLGAPPASGAAQADTDTDATTAEERSIGRNFLYVALILVGMFGLFLGVRLALDLFRARRHRLARLLDRSVDGRSSVADQDRADLAMLATAARTGSPLPADAVRDGLETARTASADPLFRVQSPDGFSVVMPGGPPTVHVSTPVDLVDHTGRSLGRAEPGTRYRVLATSPGYSLLEDPGGRRGWAPTSRIGVGPGPGVTGSVRTTPIDPAHSLPDRVYVDRIEVQDASGHAVTLYGEGWYSLDPPDTSGTRRVYDAAGRPLGYMTPELQARWLPGPPPPPPPPPSA